MKLSILMFLFLWIHFKTIAQNLRYSVAMPYISIAAYSTKQNDAFSFTTNQAALVGSKSLSAGVYGERRFMLAENNVYAAVLTVPAKRLGSFGFDLTYAGFSEFNENNIGLAYAKSLGSKVDVGIQFNYYGYRISGYGNASAINFEGGAIFHLTDRLHAGIHTYNPVGGKVGKSGEEKLAAVHKVGLGYDASGNFYFGAEIIKEEQQPVNVIAGMQYRFAKQFFARGGFRSDTGSGFGGVGISWSSLRLDVAASYHPQLGFSPGIMLIYSAKEKQ